MSEYQSFEDRLAAKRTEDKSKQEQDRKNQEMVRAKRDAERKYTNPVRREEAQARYKELLSPSQPAARPSPVQPPPEPVSGASLYHVVYEYNVDADGHVSVTDAEYKSMYFENGILKWTWESAGATVAEPSFPPDTFTVFSCRLIAT